MESKLKKPAVMWLTAAVCCILWGSAFPAIKLGYSYLDIKSGDTPTIILFAGIRFFLAGVLTVLIFSIIKRSALIPKKSAFKKIGVLAVFQTVLQYIFFYLGLAFTSGERGSVISGSSVFFAIIISAFVFRSERLKSNKIIGSVIGFIGVITVSLDAFVSSGGFIGEAFIIISSISYAFSTNFIKEYSKTEDPAMLSGWQFILGGAVMIISGLIFGGRLDTVNIKGVMITLYLAFVSAAAYSLWSILLKYNDVSRVAVCSFMTPVFGCILSALFARGESISPLAVIISLILVAAGIIIVNKSSKINRNNI